jgi:hypothetical protein
VKNVDAGFMDHVKNLEKLREIVRKQRRKLVATMVKSKKEPTAFKRLTEIQAACDALDWALDDEAASAKEQDGVAGGD